jgi:hypothetical protein
MNSALTGMVPIRVTGKTFLNSQLLTFYAFRLVYLIEFFNRFV